MSKMVILEYKGYHVVRETGNPKDSDPKYFGRVYGISDTLCFGGDAAEEFESGFKTTVNDYFETCRMLRKCPDAPVRLPIPDCSYTLKILG